MQIKFGNPMMKTVVFTSIVVLFLIGAGLSAEPLNEQARAVPNGLTLPKGYQNWKLIGVSQRNDKNSLRAILGNARAHQATFANGKWNWPEGTILAKLVWQDANHPQWPEAIVPGPLTHIEFMVKDRKKFAATGGWGYARWLGMDLEPYQNDGSECFACHTKAGATDYVFTRPAALP
jgi:hypothetical protein